MQQSLTNTIEIEVKFSDVDMLGVVWHGNYIRYFEDGREAFGRQYGLGYMDVYNAGFIVPIVNVNCDYKRFLRYEDKVIIETIYTPTESAKINFTYRLLNAQTGELIVKGSTVQVFVHRDNFELQLTNPQFFLDWKQKHGLI
ncbi:acyl-CoA thioesterase [Mucilaginibacter sp. cycad4]|uniref:acyl-CoA thioesterase n=1 Tax=Mucilaginibacter sp. cycad4 TaxID=3342096 RepID=UPI002AAB6CA2|nr:acyl-CoA thioesterase [Mucilaginibacter gossypii]WPU98762.1 acyl-CoA thioesterase [Mucilaginibacter gossypii]